MVVFAMHVRGRFLWEPSVDRLSTSLSTNRSVDTTYSKHGPKIFVTNLGGGVVNNLIYGVRKFCIPKGKPKIVESRQFRNFDANSFHAGLNLATWHLVYLEDNPNRAGEIWSRLFLEICDFHAPKRKRKIRNNYAPWLTPEIKRMMFEREKLKRAAIINNSDAHWTEIARNNVNANIRKAKANYYNRYFETNLGDGKE